MDDLVADYAALPLLKLAEQASKDVKVILSGEGGDEFFAGYSRYKRGLLDKIKLRPFRGHGEVYRFPLLFNNNVTNWQEIPTASTFSLCGTTRLQKLQARDIADWLPDDLLTKVDRCLMAYGIEGRVPFIDKKVSPMAFSLADNLKLRHGKGKWLLKTWLEHKLNALGLNGEERVWGKKKGFTVPVGEWLENKRPQLSKYMCKHEALAEYINQNNFSE